MVEQTRGNTVERKDIGVTQLPPDEGLPTECLHPGYDLCFLSKSKNLLWQASEPFGPDRWCEYEVLSKRPTGLYRYLDRHQRILLGKD